MHDLINDIRKTLTEQGDEQTRSSGRRFFKGYVPPAYGVKTPVLRKISKAHFKTIRDKDKAEIFGLCETLWRSGYLEESIIACDWSYALRKAYEPGDFEVFERWLNGYVSNWASCDTLCNHTIGTFLEQHPDYLSRLKKWTQADNRWLRRGAAVSLIVPARKGQFLNDILEIADLLLSDQDDLVQKGYGWMLKSACKMHQQEVFDFVMSKKDVMPRTALRYAIEKMPKEMKVRAMKRHGG